MDLQTFLKNATEFDYSDILTIFLTMIPVLIVSTIKYFNKSYNKYKVLRAQMNRVRAHVCVLKEDSKKKFAKELQVYIEDRDNATCTSGEVKDVISMHGVLIDASFSEGVEELRKMFDENNLPDADDPIFERYCMEKYNLFKAVVWGYYGEHYTRGVFVLKYSGREQKLKDGDFEQLRTFEMMIKKGRSIQLANGVTNT